MRQRAAHWPVLGDQCVRSSGEVNTDNNTPAVFHVRADGGRYAEAFRTGEYVAHAREKNGDFSDGATREQLQAQYLALQGSQRIKVEVLRLSHHGSSGSSSPTFVEGVKPDVCIIAVGNPIYDAKCAAVFQHVYESYYGAGGSVYAGA
jgi:hypothetical protein